MSLLNDMLRDLIHQRQLSEGIDAQDIRLLRSNSVSKSRFSFRITAVVIFLLVFFNVLALRYAWHKLENATALPAGATAAKGDGQVDIQVHRQVEAAPAAAKNTDAAPTAAHSHEKPAVTPSVLPSVVAASAEAGAHIEDLFRQAERAISMDRLTAPVEDNAYGYYQKILQLSPDNAEAQAGLVAIAERYLAKAQEQLQLGNRAQADAFVNRARFVAPDYVNAQPNMGYGDAPVIDNSLAADVPAEQSQSQPQSHASTLALAKIPVEQATTESVKTLQVTEAPSLAVKPNAGWQDEDAAREARRLFEQGREAEAVSMLKRVLVTQPQPAASASLLADIYLQQGETAAAEVLLGQLDYLPPLSRTKIKAQLAVAKGDQAGAINLLEQQLTEAQGDENYRALLASLYHKTGSYAQSVTSYQRLIGSFGEKPAYWLGLALAYDGLAQPKNALQAYLRLREFSPLQEQVKSYTDQRIAALRSQ